MQIIDTFKKLVSAAAPAAVLTTIMIAPVAIADDAAATATYRPAAGASSRASVITLSGDEAKYGVNAAHNAIEATNGGGKAGVQIRYQYKKPDDASRLNTFRSFDIRVKADDDTIKNVSAKFFFHDPQDKTRTWSYVAPLSKMGLRGKDGGWSVASLNSREFGGQNVRDMVLDQVSVAVDSTGDTKVGVSTLTYNTGSVNSANVNTEVADESVLTNLSN